MSETVIESASGLKLYLNCLSFKFEDFVFVFGDEQQLKELRRPGVQTVRQQKKTEAEDGGMEG